MLIMKFCYHGSNFRRKLPTFLEYAFRKSDKNTPLLPFLSGLKNIGYSMSIKNLILGVSSVTVSYLIRYDSLLQNVTDVITKCDSYFITNYGRSLLQNASGFLLQNGTVLLQNAIVITKCDDFMTKSDVYYILRQYSKREKTRRDNI